MVNIVNPLCLAWFFPVWSRNDILFPETFAVVIETRRQVKKSHVDRQYLKICNAIFKRTVSLFHSSKAWTRKFFPNYNLAMFFFLFSLIRKMASEGEAGSAATTETEPGEGYGSLVSPRFFVTVLYGIILNMWRKKNFIAVWNAISTLAC